MALKKRGKHRYGDTQDDLRAEILRYSEANAYQAQHFADALCACGEVVVPRVPMPRMWLDGGLR